VKGRTDERAKRQVTRRARLIAARCTRCTRCGRCGVSWHRWLKVIYTVKIHGNHAQ